MSVQSLAVIMYIISITLHEHCSGIWQQVPYVITHVVSGMYYEASVAQLDRTGQK